jgi:DNA-binding transcriptional ArsR family regulator
VDAVQIVLEPHRREILRLVWDRERRAGEIAEHFDRSFGAVSQHLSVLREAGFVTVRKDANRRYYRADQDALGDLRGVLEAMWSTTLDRLATTVEADHRGGGDRPR